MSGGPLACHTATVKRHVPNRVVEVLSSLANAKPRLSMKANPHENQMSVIRITEQVLEDILFSFLLGSRHIPRRELDAQICQSVFVPIFPSRQIARHLLSITLSWKLSGKLQFHTPRRRRSSKKITSNLWKLTRRRKSPSLRVAGSGNSLSHFGEAP
jgi:hypothetical protein